jgi:hypothetical protein
VTAAMRRLAILFMFPNCFKSVLGLCQLPRMIKREALRGKGSRCNW